MMIILFTMFFNGGIIPDYLLVNSLGLTNNMWGIIIPCGINTFNVIILRTFFLNSIPAGLQEAAQIDGCNDFMILVSNRAAAVKAGLGNPGSLLCGSALEWFSGRQVLYQ